MSQIPEQKLGSSVSKSKKRLKLKTDSATPPEVIEFFAALIIVNICFVMVIYSSLSLISLAYIVIANTVVARTLYLRSNRILSLIETKKSVNIENSQAVTTAISVNNLIESNTKENIPNIDSSLVLKTTGPPIAGLLFHFREI